MTIFKKYVNTFLTHNFVNRSTCTNTYAWIVTVNGWITDGFKCIFYGRGGCVLSYIEGLKRFLAEKFAFVELCLVPWNNYKE